MPEGCIIVEYCRNDWKLNQNLSKDGNGFIDRRELGLMLKFSGETFSQAEIEVGLAFLILPVFVFGITFVVVFQ